MASEAKPAKATKAVKADKADKSDKSKVHKLALKGSAKLVAEFKPPAAVSSDDQVRAYIKKIMGQLDRWMLRGKISKLVIVITDKDTGEHVERWQFDVEIFGKPSKSSKASKASKTASSKSADQENDAPAAEADAAPEKTEQEIQSEIAAIFRQITASVTFLPQLNGDCTFNVLVYADADSEVPVEWGDSDAKEIVNGERVQLRGFSTSNHRVDTLVSYRLAE
ncbi:mitotic spindle checkpoint component MAD2 [Colletotrichum tofieldiae]|nr:mitotic spindle checkpoint component MAD2 [Colletotrichum tofieldiae]